MKDMLNVMSKFLNMGMPIDEVILRSTWTPAREIHHEELGNLSVGSVADVAVLRVQQGHFGFVDSSGARMSGDRKLICELTVRDGQVVVRSILKMTLSADHRLIDGAMAARFINAVKQKLEDIELWKLLTS